MFSKETNIYVATLALEKLYRLAYKYYAHIGGTTKLDHLKRWSKQIEEMRHHVPKPTATHVTHKFQVIFKETCESVLWHDAL